jgi:hypothetical protein
MGSLSLARQLAGWQHLPIRASMDPVGLNNVSRRDTAVRSGCVPVFVDQAAKDLGAPDGSGAVGTIRAYLSDGW